MPFKIVYFFHLANQGWTETLYSSAGNVGAAMVAARLVINPRLALSSSTAVMDFIRVSDVAVPRNTDIVQVARNGQYAPVGGPEITNGCALMRVTAQNNKRRPMQLRGLDDNAVLRDFNGNSTPSGVLTANLAFFTAAVIANQMQIQFITQAGLLAPANVTTLAVDPANAANTIVTTAFAHGLPALSHCIFRKVPRPPLELLVGNWPVTVIDLTHFSIPYRLETPTPFTPSHMTVQEYKVDYSNITAIDFQRFATRRSGRPFVPSRGRSKGVSARR